MKNINKKLELAQEYTEFEKPKAGGYVCIITGVEDVPDREYLKVYYDIADGEFKGYYTDLKKRMGWDMPYFFKSYKDTAMSFFKGFVTSIEETNKGFKWDGETESMFIKKGVGLVFGEELYTNSKGESKKRLVVDSVHSANAIRNGDFKIPEIKDSRKIGVPDSANPFSVNTDTTGTSETESDTEQSFYNTTAMETPEPTVEEIPVSEPSPVEVGEDCPF